jgi:hypothetical protein
MSVNDDQAMARGLLRGCIECGEPFDRGDIENENIGFIEGDPPDELMHLPCRDGLIQKTLDRMVAEGKLEREWNSAAGDFQYRKAPSLPNTKRGIAT